MRRLPTPLLAVALVAASGAAATGQTTVALTGGVTLASLDVTWEGDAIRAPSFESATRPTMGLAFTLPLRKGLDVRFDGRYTRKGARWSGREPLEFASGLRIGYLELATLLKLRLPLAAEALSWYVEAGPAAAYARSCGLKEAVVVEGLAKAVKWGCGSRGLRLKDLDWGVSGGVGFEIGLSQHLGVSLGLLYSLGLRNVASSFTRVSTGRPTAIHTSSIKNRAITLQAGIARSIG